MGHVMIVTPTHTLPPVTHHHQQGRMRIVLLSTNRLAPGLAAALWMGASNCDLDGPCSEVPLGVEILNVKLDTLATVPQVAWFFHMLASCSPTNHLKQ